MTQLPTFDDAAAAITADDYKAMLQTVELTAVTLESVKASVAAESGDRTSALELRVRSALAGAGIEGCEPAVLLTHTIKGLSGKVTVISLTITHRIALRAPKGVTPEFLAIYGQVSGTVQVWPYLRELGSSITSRMGVAPLCLPLLKA